MKTIKQVEVTHTFNDLLPEKKYFSEGTMYISKLYKTAIHLCLCGCKNQVVTPLTKDGWNLTEEKNGKISLSPSIGNFNFPCKSHYIITNSKANFV
jgi:hypothetical protein